MYCPGTDAACGESACTYLVFTSVAAVYLPSNVSVLLVADVVCKHYSSVLIPSVQYCSIQSMVMRTAFPQATATHNGSFAGLFDAFCMIMQYSYWCDSMSYFMAIAFQRKVVSFFQTGPLSQHSNRTHLALYCKVCQSTVPRI